MSNLEVKIQNLDDEDDIKKKFKYIIEKINNNDHLINKYKSELVKFLLDHMYLVE